MKSQTTYARLLRLSGFALFGALLGVNMQPIEARVRLCNETSYMLQASAAYQQGVASKTEGWIDILPGDCEDALDDMPSAAQAFIYAKSDPSHAGQGLVFDGSERFCVAAENKSFTVEGRRDCRRRGFGEADMTPVASSGGRPTVTFTEKNDYGRRRARTAGVQRMLSDLQYDIGPIDGFGGERTREAEAAYKLRFGVSGNPKGADLLAKLISTMRNEASSRGLMMCNKTDHLIWAATGQLADEQFESRGWVRVPAQECAQAINKSLNSRFYFFYAEAVDANGDVVVEAGRRKIWGGDKALCSKPTRFVIKSEENCDARGFDRHFFKPIDTGSARRWTVNLE
jgi:uncharacterized membrane protein